MVNHRQQDRATTEAQVYGETWVDDPDSIDGGYYEEGEMFTREVDWQSGGQGWVPEGGGSRVYRNPTLDWPTDDYGELEEGQEVTLGMDDHETRYTVVNVSPVVDRYGTIDKLDVEVQSQ